MHRQEHNRAPVDHEPTLPASAERSRSSDVGASTAVAITDPLPLGATAVTVRDPVERAFDAWRRRHDLAGFALGATSNDGWPVHTDRVHTAEPGRECAP